MLVQHGVTFSIPTQYRHYTHRKQWYEGMFVDPVKQGLPKIFLSQVNHTTNSVIKPTAPSSPYIPRLVPIACGFCDETFIAVYEYSWQCECSYEYAIGKLTHITERHYCILGNFLLLKNFRGRTKPRKFNTWHFLNKENLQTESPGPLVASPQSSGVFLIPYS